MCLLTSLVSCEWPLVFLASFGVPEWHTSTRSILWSSVSVPFVPLVPNSVCDFPGVVMGVFCVLLQPLAKSLWGPVSKGDGCLLNRGVIIDFNQFLTGEY